MDRFPEYHPSYEGIRGWLVGLAAVLLAIPLALFFLLSDDGWSVILSREKWNSFTSPSGEHFDPRWRSIILFNVVVTGLLIVASFMQLYLFFLRHGLFPRFFIAFLSAAVTYVIVSSLLVTRIPEIQITRAAPYAWRVVIAILLGVGLSIAVLRSVRIRYTFTR